MICLLTLLSITPITLYGQFIFNSSVNENKIELTDDKILSAFKQLVDHHFIWTQNFPYENEFLDDDDFSFSFAIPNGISNLSDNLKDYIPYPANQISFGDHWIMVREPGKKAVIFSMQLPQYGSPRIMVCDFSQAENFDDLETLYCMIFENNQFTGYLEVYKND